MDEDDTDDSIYAQHTTCPSAVPIEMRVLDSNQVVEYPYDPLVRFSPLRLCKSGPALVLKPGQSFVDHQYLILFAGRVAARATYTLQPQEPDGPYVSQLHVSTPEIKLHLTASTPPHVRLVRSSWIHALISKPAGAHGSLHFMDWFGCPPAPSGRPMIGTDETGIWGVNPDGTALIPKGCPAPDVWHAVAGWLGGPIAYVDYVKE